MAGKVKSITDEITKASAATDNFGKAWERAGLQIAKIVGDSAVAKWGPDGTSPLSGFRHKSHSDSLSSMADAVAGGMKAPSSGGGGKGLGGMFKHVMGFLGGGGSKGDRGVTVNLYNQGSAATVSKATVGGGMDSATSGAGLDSWMETSVVNVILKQADTNGPAWQAITSAVQANGF
jgi:hypothetical protein